MLWHQTLCCRATWHGPVLTFQRRLDQAWGYTTWNLRRCWNSLPRIPQHQSSRFQSGPGMQSATPRGSGATWDGKLSDQVLCDSSLAFLTSPHPLPLSRISSSLFISTVHLRQREAEGGAQGGSGCQGWALTSVKQPTSAHPLALSGPFSL